MADIEITYIHHSSFMAELNHTVLLSDYSEGNIPETDKEKPLFVFTSHRHGDHFSHSIFNLKENRGNVTYALSNDIWMRQMPEDPPGRTIFLEPRKRMSLRDGAGNPVDTRAFRSTDQGVAFSASLGGRTIHHAGGLNSWVWEREPETDNRRINENLHREVGKLAGHHIDVASMLIDPRQEKDFYLGMDDFMRMVGADVVFPMHFWEDSQATARFKALAYADGYKDRVQEIHRRGEEFLV